MTAFAVRPRPAYARSLPARDPKYRALVRTLPCAICGANWGVEAAHCGSHGIGQKASDLNCIPLCRRCHRTGTQALDKLGPVEFGRVHGTDVGILVLQTQTRLGVVNEQRQN
jgi:hypothetical protein